MEEAGSQRMGAEGEYEDGNENGGATSAVTSQNLCRGLTADEMAGAAEISGGAGGGSIGTSGDWSRLGDLWLNSRNGCDEPVTRAGDCLHIDCGRSGLSPRVWRILRIAVLIPCSISTKTSRSHRHSAISSRVTTCPCLVTRRTRSSRGFRSSFSLRPCG